MSGKRDRGGEPVYSVTEVTRSIRETLEGRFSGLWVEGEISNHRCPASGHHYFTLKDAGAQLATVLFRGQAQFNRVELKDGLQVQIFGNISVYENRGQYQLIAEWVQPKGLGQLQAKFEALKAKLNAEGLFAAERKRPIPRFPRTIALVTSPTGAAVQDILNVLRRRAPWVRVLVMPVAVQGKGAEVKIEAAIRWLSSKPKSLPEIDTLIVTRGGGSLEDLWNFNEEGVARSIADCSIPVISGVGHEIDFTIADFVADRREPTPSAAAECAVPDGETLIRTLDQLNTTLEYRVENWLQQTEQTLDLAIQVFEGDDPEQVINQSEMELDHLFSQFEFTVEEMVAECRSDLGELTVEVEFLNPERDLEFFERDLDRLRLEMDALPETVLNRFGDHISHQKSLIESSSPKGILERGFSMTLDENGESIVDPAMLEKGQRVITTIAKGEFESVVTK